MVPSKGMTSSVVVVTILVASRGILVVTKRTPILTALDNKTAIIRDLTTINLSEKENFYSSVIYIVHKSCRFILQ